MVEIEILKKQYREKALAQRKFFKTKDNDCLIQKNLVSAEIGRASCRERVFVHV
jgi:hypothetical protein